MTNKTNKNDEATMSKFRLKRWLAVRFLRAIWLTIDLTYGKNWNEKLENPTLYERYWKWRIFPSEAWAVAKDIWINENKPKPAYEVFGYGSELEQLIEELPENRPLYKDSGAWQILSDDMGEALYQQGNESFEEFITRCHSQENEWLDIYFEDI